MPAAQKARLMQAAKEYLQAVQGDGRGRSGNTIIRDGEFAPAVKKLLKDMGGDQDVRTTPGQQASGITERPKADDLSPGQQAAARATRRKPLSEDFNPGADALHS